MIGDLRALCRGFTRPFCLRGAWGEFRRYLIFEELLIGITLRGVLATGLADIYMYPWVVTSIFTDNVMLHDQSLLVEI